MNIQDELYQALLNNANISKEDSIKLKALLNKTDTSSNSAFSNILFYETRDGTVPLTPKQIEEYQNKQMKVYLKDYTQFNSNFYLQEFYLVDLCSMYEGNTEYSIYAPEADRPIYTLEQTSQNYNSLNWKRRYPSDIYGVESNTLNLTWKSAHDICLIEKGTYEYTIHSGPDAIANAYIDNQGKYCVSFNSGAIYKANEMTDRLSLA